MNSHKSEKLVVRPISLGNENPPSEASSEDHSLDPAMRHGTAMRVFLYGNALLGLATIGVSIYALTYNVLLADYANTFLSVLNPDYLVIWNFLLYAPIAGGLIAFCFAIFAICFSKITVGQSTELDKSFSSIFPSCANHTSTACGSVSSCVFRSSMLAMAGLFIIQGAFGVGFVLFLQSMFHAIEQMAKSNASELGELESEISTLQLAMFNLCCYEEGWSNQGRVPSCSDFQDIVDTNIKNPCSLPSETARFSDMLCTCHSSDKYESYYDSLKKTDICKTLSDAVVTITKSDLIPGTTLPITAFVPVDAARIVGYNGTAQADKFSSSEPRGYGCGFGGYAKAFQWMQFKYTSQQSEGVAIVIIIISILELICILGVMCQVQSSSDEEFFEDMQNRFAKVLREKEEADTAHNHKGPSDREYDIYSPTRPPPSPPV